MKLSEHLRLQREDPEYVEAEKQIQFRLQIADAIIDGRIAKGWTQAELAEKIGTKQANISRLECGIANPTLSLLEKIVHILDIHHLFWAGEPVKESPSVMKSSNHQSKTSWETVPDQSNCINVTTQLRPQVEIPVKDRILQ